MSLGGILGMVSFESDANLLIMPRLRLTQHISIILVSGEICQSDCIMTYPFFSQNTGSVLSIYLGEA